MAKLTDFSFRGMPKPVQNFKDEVYTIINYGKVAHPVVAAVPAWNTYEGEMAFFHNTAASPSERVYVRLNSGWVMFAGVFGADGSGGLPDPPLNSVQYNSGGQFGGDSAMQWIGPNGPLEITPASTANATALILANTQAYAAGVTSSTVSLDFGFELDSQATSIRAVKRTDYTSAANKNSALSFHVEGADTLREVFRLHQNGFIAGATSPTLGTVSFPYFWLISTGGEAAGSKVFHVWPQLSGGSGLTVDNRGYVGIETDQPGVQLDVFNPGAQISARFNGDRTIDVPVVMSFGIANSVNTIGQITARGAGAGITATEQFGFRILSAPQNNSTGNRYIGWVELSGTVPDSANAKNEDPSVVLSGVINTSVWPTESGLTGESLILNSGLSLATQRFVIIPSSSIAAAGTPITTVSNAATVYIQGPPSVGTNATLLNRYALWVDEGPVRIDGAILSGPSEVRAGGVLFTTTALGVASNANTEITLIRQAVGTTSLVANTLSEGRTIRLTALGWYSTPPLPDSLTIRIKLGGVTLLSTGAQTPVALTSTLGWSLNAVVTCVSTGGAGTVFSQGNFPLMYTSTGTQINWPMLTSTAAIVNTTANNVLEVTAQWGGAQATEQLYMTNCIGELLN